SGMEVVSLGVCHTPLVYYAEYKMNFDACIMVTGSHNPPDYNGFKFMLGLDPFCGKDIKILGEMIIGRKFVDGSGREVVMNNIFSSYVKEIISDFQFSNDLKIAWDIGNGATSSAIKAITSMIPGRHHLLFEEMDGNFPNRSPDPTTAKSVEYLTKFVSYNNFDAGFAFDSDGDRLCVVNNAGEMLYNDQLLSVIAKDFLKKNPGAQIIADVKSCNSLFETIKSCGGIGIMEKVGHSFIKARMKSSGALLAGELSGHFYFKDRWFGFDDGVYAALRCLEILSNNKNAFSNLKYGFVTPEIRIECNEKDKFPLVESLKKKLRSKNIFPIEIDGIRVASDLGWWILRASNTQNALSLRIEAYSQENMKKIKADISQYLAEYIPNISLDT
ncbi:MAG: phosphomannomutase/phosphoglucomutase, partial [Holosporaceae bacterium]|nr:phosphomannomutase/phosphoglucomutase [Holosporaceae bacterium]